jgi:uncharacterized membrane protein YbhN (UPF0104 family)
LVHPRWAWIAVAPVGIALSHAGYTLAYREVARTEDGSELAGREAAAMVSSGFGPFSVRSGFALDARGLAELGIASREAKRRVRMLGMVEYVVLAPATLGAAAYLFAIGARVQSGLLPSWLIGVPAGTVIAVTLVIAYRLSNRRRPAWSPLRRWLDAIESTVSLLRTWPNGPMSVVGMAIYWAGDIAALAACVAIFNNGHHGSIAALIVGFATGYSLTRRSLPLAGAGVVEALLPFALSWTGLTLASALLGVVAYRLFNLWAASIPGMIGWRALQHRRAPRRAAPLQPVE